MDLDARAERLDALLSSADCSAVWFARPNGFAWLTGGSNVVDREADVGVAAAGYVPDGDPPFRLVTTDVEAVRLATEEVPIEFGVTDVPWYGPTLAEAVAKHTPTPALADFDVPGAERFDPGAVRQPLQTADVEAYRSLAEEAALAVETVCRELQPGDTEHEVAAGIRIALASREIEAPVVLVGGSERATAYRHLTPTDADLGSYCLVSVTAKRNGLHASLTRTVAFDPPTWLEDRHRAAARVEATALAATRAAASEDGDAGDVFAEIQSAYEAVGYPGEWANHHQGGAAGFAGREWVAAPDSTQPVTAPMAYAWNPTVEGAKSEDTHLVTEEEVELLTGSGQWPTAAVDAVDRALTLRRHDVLEP